MNNLAKTGSANGLQVTWALVMATVMAVALGCSREHYRLQADKEVLGLVDAASTDPRWPMDDFTILPDPTSRLYDPNDPNHPPMPPDDPSSHAYMDFVDCKKGWRHWDDNGHTPHVDNPAWRSYLPMDENGTVILDREGVVHTARIHSRDYQRELESLYLSALDVSFERFRFDCQFFGGNSTFYTADGQLRSGSSSSRLTTGTDLEMRRLFGPGGQLVVGAANSLVWQFAGPDTYGANTLLDFSLVQPLLRAGGRQVVLENLTADERALLADIRGFERFRRRFHINVIGGSGSFPSGGYWGLLRSLVEIDNEIANVAARQDSLNRLEASYEAGKDSLQQVELARQSLYTSQIALLGRRVSYQNTLERFKMGLGLPPDLDVRLDDDSLARFNLRDPAITDTRDRIENSLDPLRDPKIVELPGDFRERTSDMRRDCDPLLDMVEQDLQTLVDVLPRRSEDLDLLASREEFEKGEVASQVADVGELNRRVVERFADFYGPDFPVVDDLAGRLLKTEEDLEWFQIYKERQINYKEGQINTVGLGGEIVRTLLEIESFEEDPEAFAAEANAVAIKERAARRPDVEAELLDAEEEELDELDDATPKELLADLVGRLSSQLLELSLVQAQARVDAVTLVPVELAPEKALEIARINRRDWMNARANLVDTWRQVEIRANALESSVDVTFSGDMSTSGNDPLGFRAPTGRLRVGMRFDAPLTRTAERNSYRRALISYQQARRTYYAFEDGINQSLRNQLRTLRRSQLDFEINRLSILISVIRVDEARIGLEKPVSSSSGARSSTATRDLLNALDALLGTQNRFLQSWVDYEVLRMNLDLDLGTMELDDHGMWIDPGALTDEATDDAGLEVIPAPPGQLIPPGELIPPAALIPPAPRTLIPEIELAPSESEPVPVPESVQSLPVEPSLPLLEPPVADVGAQHASYAERAPGPPAVRSISLPTAR